MREASARAYIGKKARHRANEIAKRDFFLLCSALGVVLALAIYILAYAK